MSFAKSTTDGFGRVVDSCMRPAHSSADAVAWMRSHRRMPCQNIGADAERSAVCAVYDETASIDTGRMGAMQAPDRMSGGSFAIMALAPALSSQIQDRRFSRLADLGGAALAQSLGAGAQGAGYAAAQTLGAAAALPPPADGGRRGMAKKGAALSMAPSLPVPALSFPEVNAPQSYLLALPAARGRDGEGSFCTNFAPSVRSPDGGQTAAQAAHIITRSRMAGGRREDPGVRLPRRDAMSGDEAVAVAEGGSRAASRQQEQGVAGAQRAEMKRSCARATQPSPAEEPCRALRARRRE